MCAPDAQVCELNYYLMHHNSERHASFDIMYYDIGMNMTYEREYMPTYQNRNGSKYLHNLKKDVEIRERAVFVGGLG